jgi:hypothetical protein
MSAFSFLLLLWILFGGLWMAAGWVVAAIFMAITIIGLPWTRAAFNIAAYTLLPFGQKVVSRAVYSGRYHHRHSFCLGACEAGWTGSLANRQDNCTGRGRAIPIRGPGRGLRRIVPIGGLIFDPRVGEGVADRGDAGDRDQAAPPKRSVVRVFETESRVI